jgi:hypothetical protein
MKNGIQRSPAGRRGAWVAMFLLAGIAPGLLPDAPAHDLFTAYVQHSIRLTVGARHIDLTLDLTFFEEPSARERAVMDADANGKITRSELGAYVRNLAPRLAEQVALRVAGQEVPLMPLYDPEIDLLGNDSVGLTHHRLRLFFFAPTPAALREGADLTIEDRLWPDTKALGTLEAEGRDRCSLQPQKPTDPAFAPARKSEARLFKVRCLKPPAAPGAVPQRSRANVTGLAPEPLAQRSQP